MDVRAFHPTAAATKNIAATNATGNVQLLTGGTSAGPLQLRIRNPGTVDVFIRQGTDNTVVATTTLDMPIAAGSVEVITLNVPEMTDTGLWLAAITASGSATIYITPGVGV